MKKKPSWKIILVILIGISLIFCLSLFVFQTYPRFIIIDFPPPDHALRAQYGTDWDSTTYSVRLGSGLTPILSSRVFVWRREAGSVVDQARGITSWQSIVTYFDNQFEQKGWDRTEAYTPCDLYLPEVQFLPHGENGYVSYRPKGYKEVMDYYGGNFICLAVWKNTDSSSYQVVFVTVSQSPLDVINSISNKELPPKTLVKKLFPKNFITKTDSHLHTFISN